MTKIETDDQLEWMTSRVDLAAEWRRVPPPAIDEGSIKEWSVRQAVDFTWLTGGPSRVEVAAATAERLYERIGEDADDAGEADQRLMRGAEEAQMTMARAPALQRRDVLLKLEFATSYSDLPPVLFGLVEDAGLHLASDDWSTAAALLGSALRHMRGPAAEPNYAAAAELISSVIDDLTRGWPGRDATDVETLFRAWQRVNRAAAHAVQKRADAVVVGQALRRRRAVEAAIAAHRAVNLDALAMKLAVYLQTLGDHQADDRVEAALFVSLQGDAERLVAFERFVPCRLHQREIADGR